MVNNPSYVSNSKPMKSQKVVSLADASTIPITRHGGTLCYYTQDEEDLKFKMVTHQNVLVVPNLNANLISTKAITSTVGNSVLLDNHKATYRNVAGDSIAIGLDDRQNGYSAWIVPPDSETKLETEDHLLNEAFAFACQQVQQQRSKRRFDPEETNHRRLGHRSHGTMLHVWAATRGMKVTESELKRYKSAIGRCVCQVCGIMKAQVIHQTHGRTIGSQPNTWSTFKLISSLTSRTQSIRTRLCSSMRLLV